MIIVLCSLYFYGRILTCLCCCLDCCVNALPLCFCNVIFGSHKCIINLGGVVLVDGGLVNLPFTLFVCGCELLVVVEFVISRAVLSVREYLLYGTDFALCISCGLITFCCDFVVYVVLELLAGCDGLICRPIFTVLICWCGRCRRMLDNLDFGGLGIMQGCCVAGLDSVVHCKVISRSLVVTDLHICAAGFIVVNLLSWWVFDSDAGDVFYYGFNTSGKWLYLQGISCGLCIMFICGDAVLVVIVVFMFILQLPTWCGLGLVCWCLSI
eukprot:gene3154-2136_t